jgi:hypothetical protein
MIYPVLKFLTEQLNLYIDQVKDNGDAVKSPVSILQNIARLNDDDLIKTNNLLISLANFAEESTMKNNPSHSILRNETAEYKNPPVNLNLFVLITACMTNYENALIYLSHTITFFQGKYIFTLKNSSTQVKGLPVDFRIILDLYTLSFEQINYLWSTLGGKQQPFVCYKVRLLQIERESTTETRGVIKQVNIDGSGNS